MSRHLFTSESVTGGHPDKLADQVSDAILDAYLAQDPSARVACETATKTGLVMVFGAIYAPSIASFESLFEYFQSSLSYVIPPIVVVFILGLFVPWLNGNGAFWTILIGLVIGVPLFIVKEVTGLWEEWGLPAIHYTIMSSIMMFIGIATHLGISAMTRQDSKEDIENLVWSKSETAEIFTRWEKPLWKDQAVWAGLLILGLAGFIIWFA